MKTVKELLTKIKAECIGTQEKTRNTVGQRHKRMRSPKEITKTIRFVNGITLHYAKFIGTSQQEILNALEDGRSYWALNFYQRANLPRLDKIDGIFESLEDFFKHFPSKKYICPMCGGLSSDPQTCNTKLPAKTKSGICDWKAYGLFGCIGKGYSFICKDTFALDPKILTIFKPMELGNVRQSNNNV